MPDFNLKANLQQLALSISDTYLYFFLDPAPVEQTLEHADDVEQLKKLRQLGGEGL